MMGDVRALVRDYIAVLPVCLSARGPVWGWRLAWLWMLYGRELRMEYERQERER